MSANNKTKVINGPALLDSNFQTCQSPSTYDSHDLNITQLTTQLIGIWNENVPIKH